MIYNTRDFGEIEVKDENIITFVQPIFGFEDYKKFFMMFDDEIGDNIAWLQSAEEEGLCFVIINASDYTEIYKPQFSEKVKKQIGTDEIDTWLICVVGENMEKSTLNLKSPILINEKSRTALQTILEDSYPLRHPLLEKRELKC